jgi:ribonuclease P protein component
MFKKAHRLTTKEFNQFFKAGKKHHSPHLTVITHPYPTLKVAVVVGKKVSKTAVKRNLFKRRILAQLTTLLANKTGVFIVLVKPSFATLPRKTARTEVESAVAGLPKSK